MINPGLLTPELIADSERLELAADDTFGLDSRPLRIILGAAVGALIDRAGEAATSAYLANAMRLMRRCDDESNPLPPPPTAS